MSSEDTRVQFAAKLSGKGDPFSADRLGDQFGFDLVLLGHKDDCVTLDYRLAAQGPARVAFGRREANSRTVAYGAVLHLHAASATAPLPATRQVQWDSCLMGGIGQQRSDFHLHHLTGGTEYDYGFRRRGLLASYRSPRRAIPGRERMSTLFQR
jgi:hypothetical protein